MMPAILSFPTGKVRFRCERVGIFDERNLDTDPPFAQWYQAYSTGYWTDNALRAIGLAIGRWLDNRQQWLTRLTQAVAPIILTIEANPFRSLIERAALDVPWELLALVEPAPDSSMPEPAPAIDAEQPDSITQLLTELGPIDLNRIRHLRPTIVRRVGAAAAEALTPSQFRLSMVFMGAQPDGLTNLRAEREEAAIHRTLANIEMDLVIERSGNLKRLAELAARMDCDVVQLSCHGSMRAGIPGLILEDRPGEPTFATADHLAGIGSKLRLLFLSVCSAATVDPSTTCAADLQASNKLTISVGLNVLWPLAIDLCSRNWPAVLGWAGKCSDPAAMEFAAVLYGQLAIRVPLTEAWTQACASAKSDAWHRARLFLSPEGGGKFVNSERVRPDQPDLVGVTQFLDPATRKIPVRAVDRAFPHRREFQRVMDALRERTHTGVIVHGVDELGRATFTGHLLQRMDWELSRVIVAGDFDASSILEALTVQIGNSHVDDIVKTHRQAVTSDPMTLLPALREILEGPCRRSRTNGRGVGNEHRRSPGAAAFALVLHGFEMPGQRQESQNLSPTLMLVARAVIGAFAGASTASRLLFTCTVPFSVADHKGNDLTPALLFVHLRDDCSNVSPALVIRSGESISVANGDRATSPRGMSPNSSGVSLDHQPRSRNDDYFDVSAEVRRPPRLASDRLGIKREGNGEDREREALLNCIEQLSAARSRAEDRVRLTRALAEEGEIERDELQGVRLLYDDARAEVNGGLDRILADVALGGPADSEEVYRRIALRAETNVLSFLNASYEIIAGTDRGPLEKALEVGSALIAALLNLRKSYCNESDEQRAALAQRLEAVRWQPFDQVK